MSDNKQQEEITPLLEFLAQYGGKIVSTGSLEPEWINQARASGRLYVDESSLGYVWEPDIKQFPETEREVEWLERWYPLPVELPEHLKKPDFLFKRKQAQQARPSENKEKRGKMQQCLEALLMADKLFSADKELIKEALHEATADLKAEQIKEKDERIFELSKYKIESDILWTQQNEHIQKLIDVLSDVDEDLRAMEDYLHGKEGKMVTELRYKIADYIKSAKP